MRDRCETPNQAVQTVWFRLAIRKRHTEALLHRAVGAGFVSGERNRATLSDDQRAMLTHVRSALAGADSTLGEERKMKPVYEGYVVAM